MGVPARRPDHRLVRAVIAHISCRTGVSEEAVLSSRAAKAKAARHRAWRLIVRVSGCSMLGLADVWGCNRDAVERTFRNKPRKPSSAPVTDDSARRQHAYTMRFLYPARAGAVLADMDPATQADLAAWKALGSRHGAAA
jgi:hypothetical protein